jgi:hypothetical protein
MPPIPPTFPPLPPIHVELTFPPQLIGFQTSNKVRSIAHVESALFNLTYNTNAVFIELYEDAIWRIGTTKGTGPTAASLDDPTAPLRTNVNVCDQNGADMNHTFLLLEETGGVGRGTARPPCRGRRAVVQPERHPVSGARGSISPDVQGEVPQQQRLGKGLRVHQPEPMRSGRRRYGSAAQRRAQRAGCDQGAALRGSGRAHGDRTWRHP